MDVIDERVFLEEVASRLNQFFRDFPVEAHRLFGEPTAFGHEVAEMFRQILGQNVDVPFGVLFMSIIAGPRVDTSHVLAMDHDEDNILRGFRVAPPPEMSDEEIVNTARDNLGLKPN